jgi:alpha-tubulin suppressor-like RCC1 family protein
MAALFPSVEGICGIDKNEGKLWCWRHDRYGAVEVPEAGAGNVAAVTMEYGHCLLRRGGKVECVKDANSYSPPFDGLSLPQDALSLTSHCARTPRGIECWGSTQYGVLGRPMSTDPSQPMLSARAIHGLGKDVTHLVQPGPAACALKSSGQVWCWGMNYLGALGRPFHFCPDPNDGNQSTCAENIHPDPHQVPLNERVTDIASDPAAVCALGVSGRVWCWGENGTAAVRYPRRPTHRSEKTVRYIEALPVLNEYLGSDNTRIFAGLGTFCALKRDGSLWCWGDNSHSVISKEPYQGKRRSELPPTRMPFSCP